MPGCLSVVTSCASCSVMRRCVLVRVWPCRGPIAAVASRPPVVAFRNELRQGKFPGLLPMVGEAAAFLRVQPQLTRHLDMQIAQVKALLGFRPGVEASFRLLHDLSFFD